MSHGDLPPLTRNPRELPTHKRVHTVLVVLGVAIAAVIGILLIGRSPAADPRYHSASFQVAGDSYPYLLFAPESATATSRVPLLVVLHGCSTTASQQALASGYARLAEQRRFVVLYPDVDPADLARGDCWKGIWDPAAEGRGRGDAGAIAAMTRTVIRTWRIDPDRVYVIGISAGGFESSILGASYPDLYAAIGIHSGAAFLGGDPGCLAEGESPTRTAALAHAALAAMGGHARVVPVIVFHGDQDPVIPYHCGRQALQQWLETDNLILRREHRAVSRIPPTVSVGAVPHGLTYTVESYADGQGCPVAQLWTIHGMGHAWSGGSRDPSIARYSDPGGPSAAGASATFFLHWTSSGPRGPCVPGRG